MSQNAEQVIATIQRLPPAEQDRIAAWFEQRKPSVSQQDAQTTDAQAAEQRLENEVLQRLLATGVISEIVQPMSDEEDDEYAPLEIEGEPLSETIIRERR